MRYIFTSLRKLENWGWENWGKLGSDSNYSINGLIVLPAATVDLAVSCPTPFWRSMLRARGKIGVRFQLILGDAGFGRFGQTTQKVKALVGECGGHHAEFLVHDGKAQEGPAMKLRYS